VGNEEIAAVDHKTPGSRQTIVTASPGYRSYFICELFEHVAHLLLIDGSFGFSSFNRSQVACQYGRVPEKPCRFPFYGDLVKKE
jgi:hypothetical protein